MKNILAFGDSLTWGFEAGTFARHPFEVRWPNALAAGLNGKARVIEEGMNGRTTVFPDPTDIAERNGAVALPMLLIEIVQRFPWIKTASPPQILIMAPPALCKTNDEWFNDLWGHAIEESKLFARHYARVAEEMGVHFFDAGTVAKTDPTDGGHIDARSTQALGVALVPVVKKILSL